MDILSILIGAILGNLIWVNYQIQVISSDSDHFKRGSR